MTCWNQPWTARYRKSGAVFYCSDLPDVSPAYYRFLAPDDAEPVPHRICRLTPAEREALLQ